MSLQARLRKIEVELDNSTDFDSPRYIALEAEANILADELNALGEVFATQHELRQEEERKSAFRQKIESKYGNYDDWYTWAKTLYSISLDFKVVSLAKEWEEEKSWQFFSNIECLEKVEQLIEWKHYDHHIRKA